MGEVARVHCPTDFLIAFCKIRVANIEIWFFNMVAASNLSVTSICFRHNENLNRHHNF